MSETRPRIPSLTTTPAHSGSLLLSHLSSVELGTFCYPCHVTDNSILGGVRKDNCWSSFQDLDQFSFQFLCWRHLPLHGTLWTGNHRITPGSFSLPLSHPVVTHSAEFIRVKSLKACSCLSAGVTMAGPSSGPLSYVARRIALPLLLISPPPFWYPLIHST